MRSGFFTKTEEARNSGSVQKTEAALHTVLFFVGPDELLVGKLARSEHIGRDEEGSFALHRAGDRLVGNADRRLDLPLCALGRCALAWASRSVLLGVGHKA